MRIHISVSTTLVTFSYAANILEQDLKFRRNISGLQIYILGSDPAPIFPRFTAFESLKNKFFRFSHIFQFRVLCKPASVRQICHIFVCSKYFGAFKRFRLYIIPFKLNSTWYDKATFFSIQITVSYKSPTLNFRFMRIHIFVSTTLVTFSYAANILEQDLKFRRNRSGLQMYILGSDPVRGSLNSQVASEGGCGTEWPGFNSRWEWVFFLAHLSFPHSATTGGI
jgi:hypothetical protein